MRLTAITATDHIDLVPDGSSAKATAWCWHQWTPAPSIKARIENLNNCCTSYRIGTIPDCIVTAASGCPH